MTDSEWYNKFSEQDQVKIFKALGFGAFVNEISEGNACDLIGRASRIVYTIAMQQGTTMHPRPFLEDNKDGTFTSYDPQGNPIARYKVTLIERLVDPALL